MQCTCIDALSWVVDSSARQHTWEDGGKRMHLGQCRYIKIGYDVPQCRYAYIGRTFNVRALMHRLESSARRHPWEDVRSSMRLRQCRYIRIGCNVWRCRYIGRTCNVCTLIHCLESSTRRLVNTPEKMVGETYASGNVGTLQLGAMYDNVGILQEHAMYVH